MRILINDVQVELLGDPHRGRPFFKGVPLHRRGEREAMQKADFVASLERGAEADIHVCMGDLFDRVNVANNVVIDVAMEYRDAELDRVVVIPGNHDISRDTTVKSSFELFEMMMRDHIQIPMLEPLVRTIRDTKLVFIPWSPIMTAHEMVEKHVGHVVGADAVFGHWDVVAIHATENLIPAALLKSLGVKRAITGHDHLQRELELDGLQILVTGSMQPYSHAEDPEESIYVTRSLDQLEGEDFTNKCLRVRLQPGEICDVTINCLAFTTITTEEEAAEALVDVGFEAFDFTALWGQAFEGVDPDIGTELLEKFREIGGEE